VVEVATNTKELVAAVNGIAEVNIVNLVNISLVHVVAEEGLGHGIGGANLEEVNYAEELLLGNVSVLGDIEVLEDGLEENAAGSDSLLVFSKDGLKVDHVFSLEVLSAGENCLAFGHGGNFAEGVLLDSIGSEGLVDGGAELNVVEELLGVGGNILVSESLVLLVGEGEAELGKDGAELGASHTALSELVEVEEELLNADALHDDHGADAVLNVGGVAAEVDAGLHVAVGNNIDLLGRVREESGLLGGSNTVGVDRFGESNLGNVGRENVLGTIQILAELVVVHFSGGAQIAVLANEKVKSSLGGRHKAKSLQNAEELVGGYVQRLAAIEVLKAGLKQNAVGLDSFDHRDNVSEHGVLLGVSKSGSRLGALNDSCRVGGVSEDSIDFVAEAGVVNQVGNAGAVLDNEGVNFGLGEANLEGAEAGAELGRRLGSSCNLQQHLRRFLCVTCRSR
jgi:hypothetical protein